MQFLESGNYTEKRLMEDCRWVFICRKFTVHSAGPHINSDWATCNTCCLEILLLKDLISLCANFCPQEFVLLDRLKKKKVHACMYTAFNNIFEIISFEYRQRTQCISPNSINPFRTAQNFFVQVSQFFSHQYLPFQ